MSAVFEAAYEGICPDCSKWFKPGTRIRQGPDGYVHDRCPRQIDLQTRNRIDERREARAKAKREPSCTAFNQGAS